MKTRHPDLLEAPPPAGAVVATSRDHGVEIAVLSFPVTADPPPRLTRAERAIARAVLEGKSNAQLAMERGRSVHTIGNQIAALFLKLGVGSRLELALRLANVDVGELHRDSSSEHTAPRSGSRSAKRRARER